MMRGKPIQWAEAEVEFIKQNYKNYTKPVVCEMLKKELGIIRTPIELKHLYHKNGWTSGLNTQFKKGNISHNKGKKMPPEVYAKVAKTMFKKGNKPHNTLPLGSEVFYGDDRYRYWLVKIAEPNVWKPKHHIIYEKYYGAIPENHAVVFLDGDVNNMDINNLRLVTRGDLANFNHSYGSIEMSAEQRNISYDIIKITSKLKARAKNDRENM